jgi:hypothetical protein
VSRKSQNFDLKNELLMLHEIYKQRQKQSGKNVNVNKFLRTLATRTKSVISRIARWIMNKTRRWIYSAQISLFAHFNNEPLLELVINSCQSHEFKEYLLSTSLLVLTSLVIGGNGFNKVNLLKNVRLRWLSWLVIVVSSGKMLSLTIYLELLRQNVESNPGMVEGKTTERNKKRK